MRPRPLPLPQLWTSAPWPNRWRRALVGRESAAPWSGAKLFGSADEHPAQGALFAR